MGIFSGGLFEYWQMYWFQFVEIIYYDIFRMGLFGFPLYVLLSRNYSYSGDLPNTYIDHWYETNRILSFIWFYPSKKRIQVIHLIGIISSSLGLL